MVLRKGREETLVQWFDDEETCRRFFPAEDDPEFGFRLHETDLAVNKILCAASRKTAARDAVDLVNIVERSGLRWNAALPTQPASVERSRSRPERA